MKLSELRLRLKESLKSISKKPDVKVRETITRSQLKEVIKETLRSILKEGLINPPSAPISEAQISPEELQSMWEEDKRGEYIQINPDDSVVYVAHGKAMEKIVAYPSTRGKYKFNIIGRWMRKNQFSPNIWQVNDHGNVELYSPSGRAMGGLTETLQEMTVTGDVAPINLPGNVKGGWVSGKGGSARGLAGSKSLGYELTPIGKQEMARKQDKVYEQ